MEKIIRKYRLLRMLLACVIAAAACVSVPAQRRTSLNRKLKPVPAAPAPTDAAYASRLDSVAATADMVRFSGYEKTLRSTRETLFVSNLCESEIEGMVFTITYLDSSGRQLHEVRRVIHTSVPPGETRRIDFPSWDRQLTFYYSGSPRPRVPAIPYDIKLTPDTLFLLRSAGGDYGCPQ